jgi:hypothetical protein
LGFEHPDWDLDWLVLKAPRLGFKHPDWDLDQLIASHRAAEKRPGTAAAASAASSSAVSSSVGGRGGGSAELPSGGWLGADAIFIHYSACVKPQATSHYIYIYIIINGCILSGI